MQASAFIVGPQDGPGLALAELAKSLGFASVAPFTALTLAEQQVHRTPLCFFLFAAVEEVGALQAPVAAVRDSGNRRIRFAPLVYFSETPLLEAIRRCVDMGFDDVITLPFSRERVLARLRRQVGRPLTYFETETYFGPDRHRQQAAHPNRGAGGRHRRLDILRTTENGPTVIREEVRLAA